MAHYKETHRGAMGVDFTLHLEGDEMVFQHTQDTNPVLDRNARLRQHQQFGTRHMGARLVASVPFVIENQWKQEFREKTGHRASERGWAKVWHAFKMAKLDLPEFKKFRVDEGRIGSKTDVGGISMSTSIGEALRGK